MNMINSADNGAKSIVVCGIFIFIKTIGFKMLPLIHGIKVKGNGKILKTVNDWGEQN